MEQEKDKDKLSVKEQRSRLNVNFNELEELMNLIDPYENIFVQSKSFVKELKKESTKHDNEKDDFVLKR